MKILLDSCVWGGAMKEFASAGHDVLWVGSAPPDPGDEAVLRQAHLEGRILITLDKDFGELAIVQGRRHSGILRLVNIAAKQQSKVSLRILELHGEELSQGAIITAETDRLRIRPPEDWQTTE